MTSREEQSALMNLQELLAGDISKTDMDTLLAGVRDAELVFDQAQDWSGRLVAELKRRGLSWPVLSKMTGVPQTTLIRRAQHYL